jgi:hypothetical protein
MRASRAKGVKRGDDDALRIRVDDDDADDTNSHYGGGGEVPSVSLPLVTPRTSSRVVPITTASLVSDPRRRIAASILPVLTAPASNASKYGRAFH